MDMNAALSNKQQEILDREQAILRVAAPMILEEGYQKLSMDRIAAELKYAKGTIYNHFPNKEEIILALAIEAIQLRQSMFKRAVEYPGLSRERLQAVGAAFELYVRNYPQSFKLEQIIWHDPVWDKASEQRREIMQTCEKECMQFMGAVIHAAIEAGDLQISAYSQPAELLFSFWALSYGAYVHSKTGPSLSDLGIHDVYRVCRVGSNRLMNGIPWRPVRTEAEDMVRFEQLANELFPEEVKKIPNFSLVHQD